MPRNPTDFTKAESAKIAAAYAALQYIADTTDCSAPLRLAEALKYEARQRSRTVARALVVAEALAGMQAEIAGAGLDASPAQMWGISAGCAVAHMFGAYVGSRQGYRPDAEQWRARVRDFIALAGECAKAQEARQQRRRAAVAS